MAVVAQRENSPKVGSDTSIGNCSEDDQMEQNPGESLLGGNQGWANVFAKVLTQNPKVKKTKKTLVLAKAKKDAEQIDKGHAKQAKGKSASGDARRPRREPMKIVDKEGNVVDEEEQPSSDEADESSTDEEDQTALTKDSVLERQRLRRQRMELGLVVPQPGDPYEKNLIRTATKGVVQLFNAVNKFQEEKRKKRDDDSSDEDDRRYKKGRFMETLNRIQEKKRNDASAGKSTSKWEALREDFMTNSKMRDWDKQASDADDSDDEERPRD